MIFIATAVEANLLDAGGDRPFGNRAPHGFGRLLIAAVFHRALEGRLGRGCSRQRTALRVID